MDKVPFKISTLFTSKNGDTDIKKEHINGKGHPVVSSGQENAGIIGFSDIKARIIPANTITVDMFGNVYYRDFEYKIVTHARAFALLPNGFLLNEKTGLYLTASLSWLSNVFSYDNMCSYNKIMDMNVSLPVIESPDPDHEYTVDDIDWQYMRDRIAELEQDRIAELDAYLKVTGLEDYELTDEDRKVLSKKPSYASFEIGSVFEPLKVGFIGKGQKIGSATKEPDEEHCVPLTCAKIGDNGIMYWGKKGDFITYKNTLAVIADGAVSAGLVYAQPEEAGAYSHSYFIDTKTKGVSKYAKEYLSTVLTKVVYPKYSREDAPRWNKIEKDVIYLPVTSNGDIDFDYMERYIRAIEKMTIADVVKYRDQELYAAKQAVC